MSRFRLATYLHAVHFGSLSAVCVCEYWILNKDYFTHNKNITKNKYTKKIEKKCGWDGNELEKKTKRKEFTRYDSRQHRFQKCVAFLTCLPIFIPFIWLSSFCAFSENSWGGNWKWFLERREEKKKKKTKNAENLSPFFLPNFSNNHLHSHLLLCPVRMCVRSTDWQ